MGIFSRLGEVLNANINHLLEHAEDPERTVRQMVYEMEDVLTELKSSAAEIIAHRIRLGRRLTDIEKSARDFGEKAELAVGHGRDDLAREALELKLICLHQAESLNEQLNELVGQVKAYQVDIARLEAKLEETRRRKAEMVARGRQALSRRKAHGTLVRFDKAAVMAKFEELEAHVDRLQAENEVHDRGEPYDLSRRFAVLEGADRVEAELAALRKKNQRKNGKDK